MSFAERQIVALLRAGIDTALLIRWIERGEHLHWKAPVVAQEAKAA
jgi:hypothetical protein